MNFHYFNIDFRVSESLLYIILLLCRWEWITELLNGKDIQNVSGKCVERVEGRWAKVRFNKIFCCNEFSGVSSLLGSSRVCGGLRRWKGCFPALESYIIHSLMAARRTAKRGLWWLVVNLECPCLDVGFLCWKYFWCVSYLLCVKVQCLCKFRKKKSDIHFNYNEKKRKLVKVYEVDVQ